MAAPPPHSFRFGRFDLLRRIGAGGMGEIFLARQEWASGAEKLVVVKKILPELSQQQGFVQRFHDEGKLLVHLTHGNIAQIFEMGDVNGELFMSMEYVEGQTAYALRAALDKAQLAAPIELVLWLGLKVLEGLSYAHHKSDMLGNPLHIVHRDVSPMNLMITYDGEVKIIDFGAALSTLKTMQTKPNTVIGNLSYMSPEQVLKKPMDPRSDLFSLGVVLWTLMGGQHPDYGGSLVLQMRDAAEPSWESIRRFRPDASPEVEQLLAKALRADPARRFADADEMHAAISRVLAKMGPMDQRVMAALMNKLFAAARKEHRAFLAEALPRSGAGATGQRAAVVPKPALPAPRRGLHEGPDESTDAPTDPFQGNRRGDTHSQEVTVAKPVPAKPPPARPPPPAPAMPRRMTIDDAIRPPPTTAELLLDDAFGGKPAPAAQQSMVVQGVSLTGQVMVGELIPNTSEMPTEAPAPLPVTAPRARPQIPSAPGVGDASLDGMVTQSHDVEPNLGEQATLARELTPEQIAELGQQFATPSRLRPNVEAKREKAQVRNRLIAAVVGALVLSAVLGGLYLKYAAH